jgi:hypothetical protein
MNSKSFGVGDWIEVRSKEEILQTLDKHGQLEALPFMPQMFQYCGKRFKVYKRAHKTCDTVDKTGGRRMSQAIHLDLRCDGKAHGGCQAGCLLFWKEVWLKPGTDPTHAGRLNPVADVVGSPSQEAQCTEQLVWAGTIGPGRADSHDPVFVCQATTIPKSTTLLHWWDLRQYVEDLTSGNVGWGKLLRGVLYASYYNFSRLGIGVGKPMRWFYDSFQVFWGGVPYPRKCGSIPLGQKTPYTELNLQIGELVRVKSYQAILATLDTDNKNRGLYFDAEAVPYCGGTYRVARRITQIIDEKTGRMLRFRTPSIVLDRVFCQSRYSDCRMFCPRSIESWWRETWLERVAPTPNVNIARNAAPSELQPASR